MAYPLSTIAECRRLFVEDGLTPTQIAAVMGGKPSRAAVSGWSNEPDEAGKTWHDLRAAFLGATDFHEMTPRALARKLLEQISTILERGEIDSKAGNTLIQLHRVLQDLSGPAFMVPAMYEVLTDFVLYLRQHGPATLTPEFLELLRGFKDGLRARLDEPGRRVMDKG